MGKYLGRLLWISTAPGEILLGIQQMLPDSARSEAIQRYQINPQRLRSPDKANVLRSPGLWPPATLSGCPFGVEPSGTLLKGSLSYKRTLELGAGWVRLVTHV